ncbi:MAG: hypothetical protein EKK40_16210 [Bradyrhizobiaceae bacterium]|nr:MAG: hypothetical protein EKK40_16210 [Bradyrhizobiaceae bacterium]
MKSAFALSATLTIWSALAAVTPAAAADLPADPVYTRPAYVPPPRVLFVPGCRLGVERFWDGFAWRSRSIQICN